MGEKEFTAIMVKAYREHRIPQWYVFKPYFEWVENNRCGRIRPCRIREMRRVALSLLKRYDEKHYDAFDRMGTSDRTDPFFPYDAYGDDKEVVSILNQINEELTSFIIEESEKCCIFDI